VIGTGSELLAFNTVPYASEGRTRSVLKRANTAPTITLSKKEITHAKATRFVHLQTDLTYFSSFGVHVQDTVPISTYH
jgi:hypothetical protein